MTRNEKLKEIYSKLSKDFPDEALSNDTSRGFALTSVKAQYIIERLNEVLGIGNWVIDGEYAQDESGGIKFQGYLTVWLHKVLGEEVPDILNLPAIGYSEKKRQVGDTFKGSRTDALSKAASYLGVANNVFKGKIAPPSSKPAVKSEPKKEVKYPDTFKNKKPKQEEELDF